MLSIILIISYITIVYSTSPYEFVRTSQTFAAANAHCQNKFGTTLASITSKDEQKLAFDLCGSSDCWIGLNDIDNEGTFKWLDDEDFVYTNNFRKGKSRNARNKHCIVVSSKGSWVQTHCNNSKYFLCNAPNALLFKNIQSNVIINEFRTFDGTNNNLNNDLFGIHNGPIIREVPGAYGKHGKPAREDQRSARIISNIVSDSNEADTSDSDVGLSNLAWLFGQLMDHEIVEQTASMEDRPETRLDETQICIAIGVDDLIFTQDDQFCINFPDNALFNDTDETHRLINIATSYIDASAIYGSEPDRIFYLRNNDGTMKTSTNENGDINLPFNTFGITNAGGNNRTDFYVTGEPRVNEHVALTAIHTTWIREHNRLYNLIKNANPSLSNSDLFEYTRLVNNAQLQHIIFNEWLPTLYGENNIDTYINTTTEYNNECDASTAAHFSFVAFRLGHTMVTNELGLRDSLCNINGDTHINVIDAFFVPDTIRLGNATVDRILNGLACEPARNIDTFIISALRNFLFFGFDGSTDPLDLMAINIGRGRDDGLTDYATLREFFSLQRPLNAGELSNLFLNDDTTNRILNAYDNNINVIDPIVGAFAEKHINGGAIGKLIAESISEQLQRLIDCDRFFYKRYISGDLLKYVESQTMQNIIKLNSNPTIEFGRNHQFVFNIPGKGLNKNIKYIHIKSSLLLCISTFNNYNNNNPITIEQCLSGNDSKQIWYYNTKSKEIINHRRKCLTIKENDFKHNSQNANVLLFECNGQANQKWFINKNNHNNINNNGIIRNILDQCLTVQQSNPGTQLQTTPCQASPQSYQKWVYLGDKI